MTEDQQSIVNHVVNTMAESAQRSHGQAVSLRDIVRAVATRSVQLATAGQDAEKVRTLSQQLAASERRVLELEQAVTSLRKSLAEERGEPTDDDEPGPFFAEESEPAERELPAEEP